MFLESSKWRIRIDWFSWEEFSDLIVRTFDEFVLVWQNLRSGIPIDEPLHRLWLHLLTIASNFVPRSGSDLNMRPFPCIPRDELFRDRIWILWLWSDITIDYGFRVGEVSVLHYRSDNIYVVCLENEPVAEFSDRAIALKWKSDIESGRGWAIKLLSKYDWCRYRGWSPIDRSLAVSQFYESDDK